MPLKPLSEITGSLFPELPTSSPDSGAPQGVRAFRRAELWREGLTRAWGYWRGKASSEHEAARIDAAFEEQLAEGPDFARYHRDSASVHYRDTDIRHLGRSVNAVTPLRANDSETSESEMYSLEGEGQPSRGHAKQKSEDGGARNVGSASASDVYGADEAACSGRD